MKNMIFYLFKCFFYITTLSAIENSCEEFLNEYQKERRQKGDDQLLEWADKYLIENFLPNLKKDIDNGLDYARQNQSNIKISIDLDQQTIEEIIKNPQLIKKEYLSFSCYYLKGKLSRIDKGFTSTLDIKFEIVKSCKDSEYGYETEYFDIVIEKFIDPLDLLGNSGFVA